MKNPIDATHIACGRYFKDSGKYFWYYTPSNVWRLWLTELPNDMEKL